MKWGSPYFLTAGWVGWRNRIPGSVGGLGVLLELPLFFSPGEEGGGDDGSTSAVVF